MTNETAAAKVARVAAAKKEAAAIKAWKLAGSKGTQPKTPTLDAMNEQLANGGRTVRTSRATGERKPKVTVRFFHDGRPMPDSQNKLSSVAWYFTKGIGGKNVERIGVDELKKVLAKAGVSEPTTTHWSVKLTDRRAHV